MKAIAGLVGIYGLCVIGGGLIGYFLAGSTASVIWGSLSGFLMLLAGIGIYKNWTFALYGASIISIALSVFFIYRYAITKSWVPAGGMMIFSLIVLGATLFAYKTKIEKQ